METKYKYFVKFKGLDNPKECSENVYQLYLSYYTSRVEDGVEYLILKEIYKEPVYTYTLPQNLQDFKSAFHFLLGKVIGAHLTETNIDVKNLSKELNEQYNIDVTEIINRYLK